MAWFRFNGVDSRDYNIKIHKDVFFVSPERDISFVQVPGRDGDLAIDNGRYNAYDYSIPITLNLKDSDNVDRQTKRITEWLKTNEWGTLELSWSPDYQYKAICFQTFDMARTLETFGRTVINFRLQPIKYQSKEVILTDGYTLVNRENRASKPLIHIEGTGDITINKNGVEWLVLTSVDNYITIDSELMSVYKDNLPQYEKMNSSIRPLFPVIDPGENTFTITGNATSITMDCRWESVT